MEASHHRTERFYLKLLFGSLLALVLLIALIWGCRGFYVRWQEKRLLRSAIVAMQNGDGATASLAARAIIQLKPNSAGAARIMAELNEKSGNRAALDWRRKIVDSEPQSVDNALALARTALRFNEPQVAEQALSKIESPGKETADYHATAALLAQAQKDDAKAEREWEQAVKMAPDKSGYRLQLATLQLRSSAEPTRAAGRASLNALRGDPEQRAPALRALISYDVSHHESGEEILTLARELRSLSESTIADRLIYLDIVRQLGAPEFTSYLTELEATVPSKPLDLAAFLEWMSRNNLNLFALDYIKTLPADSLKQWPVPLAIAQLYDRLKDWKKLEQITQNSSWQQGEFMRHAYLAKALRAQDKRASAEHEWSAAVKEASGKSQATLALMRTTADWKWDKEKIELLWTLTNDPEKQEEAIQELYHYYAREGDTQGLYRALVRWAEFNPTDLNVQNNLAQVSLLLDANPDEARKVAAELHQKEPSNPAYTATYAYSLLTKGNPKDAAKAMSSLTADQLRDPAISAYYGICLAAVHDEKAREFLAAGETAPLLPEEKRLINKASASLDSWRRIR